jgi:hypothetical protein
MVSPSRSFVAWTLVIVGVLMAAQWFGFLVTGSVPELHTQPVAIGFHLVAEAATAVLLVIAGVGLLRGLATAPRVGSIAVGMLIYTVINSAGYFGEQGAWGMVAMFGALLLVAIASAAALFRADADRPEGGGRPLDRGAHDATRNTGGQPGTSTGVT